MQHPRSHGRSGRLSEADIERRRVNVPRPQYPEDLPVVALRDEIAKTIEANQVVIVSGETGSGKTTQLPKICLEVGRGITGLIGHTQPRRIAARTVATRIAHELRSPLGHAVGYKVRFSDKLSADTYIKLMTDGILLAETQHDRDLRAYDTIIIDEAHERSLNIDFLLGYLRRLLPRRPDLKVIVTSATIDADRFATHFAGAAGPAPVINVSGRTFPVEMRYRALDDEEADDGDAALEQAILDAVDELTRERQPGDILVFLPGEREIRETAEALRKHHPQGAEILPLYARLSFEEQERVFRTGGARRIVLATNVAETSLTVPGIRYVVDTGYARVNRYSYRNKVELLQTEKISRASANQRAGRCGRVGPGVCIRLYAEADYQSRPAYTDPEILRSSLAAVILRMKSLRIGEVEDFPFLEAPTPRMIADGYQLLGELGAVDERNALTPVGAQLARFPIDPRIARMVIAAKQENCLAEVLIVASALSIQDPRERPFDKADAADRAHEPFVDNRSDFMSYLKLWAYFDEAVKHRKSNRKLIDGLHERFLSHRRMREWREVHAQLASLVAELGMHANETPATFEQIHRAMLAGLLGNIGFKHEEGDYLGARGIRFHLFPGSGLRKAQPKWIVAADLMETARLYARCAAKIEPDWLEPLARHLVKRHYFDPHWEKERAMVIAFERVTLYGLTIVPKRRVHYGPIDPTLAREIFIRSALVAGDYVSGGKFLQHNQNLMKDVQRLENKARRRDVLVDDSVIYAFYDAIVPADICNGAGFEKWRKDAEEKQPQILHLTRETLMRHGALDVTEEQFPETMKVEGVPLRLQYRFEPAHALDGVTVTVPLHLLNKLGVTPFDWLVPGLIREKVTACFKSFPKTLRRHLVPIPEHVTRFLQWSDGERRAQTDVTFADTVRQYVQRETGAPVPVDAWDEDGIPQHLRVNFRVVDDAGRELAMGRDLDELKGRLGEAAQLTFGKAEAGIEREGIKVWDFGDLPEKLAVKRQGRSLTGYPALVDEGESVAIRLFDIESAAATAHRAGVVRLMRLVLKEQMKQLERQAASEMQATMQLRGIADAEALRDDFVAAIVDRAFIGDDTPPRSASGFEAQVKRARTRLPAVLDGAKRLLAAVAEGYHRVVSRLNTAGAGLSRPAADIRAQLSRLVYKGFFSRTDWDRLSQLPRYLKGMELRLDKYGSGPDRDAKHAASIADLTRRLDERMEKLRKAGSADPRLDDFRWQLEELRVSLFAQELRTPYPVSYKRLDRMWASFN